MEFSVGMVEEPDDESVNGQFVRGAEGLSSISDIFCDNTVVFSSAGSGAVFAEIIHFSSDTDEGPAGSFVQAVFGKLLFAVEHRYVCLKRG